MIRLVNARDAWGSQGFNAVLKAALEGLGLENLPLQQALTQSSYVKDTPVTVSILRVEEQPEFVSVKAGVFFKGLIPGCSCADDPTPMDEYNEYCELLIQLNKRSGEASISLAST